MLGRQTIDHDQEKTGPRSSFEEVAIRNLAVEVMLGSQTVDHRSGISRFRFIVRKPRSGNNRTRFIVRGSHDQESGGSGSSSGDHDQESAESGSSSGHHGWGSVDSSRMLNSMPWPDWQANQWPLQQPPEEVAGEAGTATATRERRTAAAPWKTKINTSRESVTSHPHDPRHPQTG